MKKEIYHKALQGIARPMGEIMSDDSEEAAARLGPVRRSSKL